MNSTDLGIYLDTLGFTGKIIRLINWLAPWALILGGIATLLISFIGFILVYVFVAPTVILTILIDIATLVAYKLNKPLANKALKILVFAILLSPPAIIAFLSISQSR